MSNINNRKYKKISNTNKLALGGDIDYKWEVQNQGISENNGEEQDNSSTKSSSTDNLGGFNGAGIAGAVGSLMPQLLSSAQQYGTKASDNANLLGTSYAKERENFNNTTGILGALGLTLFNDASQNLNNLEDSTASILNNINTPKTANTYDEALNNTIAYRKQDYSFENPYDSEFKNFIKSTGEGAAVGTSIYPGIGTAFGGLAGALNFVFNNGRNQDMYNKGISSSKKAIDEKEYLSTASLRNNMNMLNAVNARKNATQAAYGGPIGISLNPVGSAIDYMQNEELLASLGEDKTRNNNRRISMPMFAFGGALGGYGGDWSNGLNFIKAGGTHGENPIGGVPMGIAQDGMPNLVEEGEVVWNDYVFSNRINVPKETMERLGIKGKDTMTFAEAVEKVQKSSAERPNDPIEKRGLDAVLAGLMQKQEEIRQSKAEEEQFNEMEDMAAFAADGGPIHIAKNKKGTFTAAATKHGMGVQEFAGHVLANKDKYSSAMVKKANFARNASKWHHALGGYLFNNGGPKDKIKKAIENSNRQPIHGTWNGLYDWIMKDKPLVQQIPAFTGFGGGDFAGSGASGEWGDTDYIRNVFIPPVTETFDEAFARNRRAGNKTFMFNGKLYNTEIDPNYNSNAGKKRQQVITPAMNEREVYTNVGEKINDSTRVEPYVGQPIGWTEREIINGREKKKYIGSSPFKALGGHLFRLGGPDDPPYNWQILQEADRGVDLDLFSGVLNYPEYDQTWNLIPKVPTMIDNMYALEPDDIPITSNRAQMIHNLGISGNTNVAQNYWVDQNNLSKDTKINLKKNPNPVTADVLAEHRAKLRELPTSGWQTGLRYAPVLGSAISLGYNLFNKPDYQYADKLSDLASSYRSQIGNHVMPRYLGDYLTYNPFDRLFYANELRANQAATNSAISNMGNGNLGAAMALRLANDYNNNIALGKLFREGEEYNLNQRQKVAEFNRGTNMFNIQNELQAKLAGRNDDINLLKAANETDIRALAMKQAIDQNRGNLISGDLTNLFQTLGDIGWEANQGYWNNALINSGYYGTPNESMYDIAYGRRKAACGGKLSRKKKKGLTI